jgi:hypothetical protein
MKKVLILAAFLFLIPSPVFAKDPGYEGIYGYGGHQNYPNYSNRSWKSILPPLRTQTIYSFGKIIFGPPQQIYSNTDIYYTTPRINNYMPNYPNSYVCSNADLYKGLCR